MTDKTKLKKKIFDGERISCKEALTLFSWNLAELGLAADYRRKIATPEEEVGFVIDRIINYANICKVKCSFCAFYARPHMVKAFKLNTQEILDKIGELVDAGGTQVMLQGGLDPKVVVRSFFQLVLDIKDYYPDIHLHSFSPAEIIHLAAIDTYSINEIIENLHLAGLDSVPGASDILVERIRKKLCPRKCTVLEWRAIMRFLKLNKMFSSATMTYGLGETLEERIEHLKEIRYTQDITGIIRAFIPWSFSPARTSLYNMPRSTGNDYLRIIAISRIFLDNIPYIQAGWLTEGLKLAQIALTMGANDMGGVLTEELVLKATGIRTKTNIKELIDIIKETGKKPFQRNSEYKPIKYFD